MSDPYASKPTHHPDGGARDLVFGVPLVLLGLAVLVFTLHLVIAVWLDPGSPWRPRNGSSPWVFYFPLPMAGLFSLGLGLRLIGAVIRKWWVRRQREARERANPRQPWRTAEGRPEFQVEANVDDQVLESWADALLCNLLAGLVPALMAFSRVRVRGKVLGFFLLVGIGGIFLLVRAIYRTLQRLKYGRASLQLERVPLVPGQECSVVMQVPEHIVEPDGVVFHLHCAQTDTAVRWHKGSASLHTVTHDVYSYRQTVRRDLSVCGRSRIPLRFAIPADQPANLDEGNPTRQWKLTVSAETPGIDFAAEFDLPVLDVEDLSLVDRRPG
jgi:hypothetical protein